MDLSLFEKVYCWSVIDSICDSSDSIENIPNQIQGMLIESEA